MEVKSSSPVKPAGDHLTAQPAPGWSPGSRVACQIGWSVWQAAHDIAALCDPLRLLDDPPRPLKNREATTVPSGSAVTRRARADSDLDEAMFASPSQSRSGSQHVSHAGVVRSNEPALDTKHEAKALAGTVPLVLPAADSIAMPVPGERQNRHFALQLLEQENPGASLPTDGQVSALVAHIDKGDWAAVADSLTPRSLSQMFARVLGQQAGAGGDTKHSPSQAVRQVVGHPTGHTVDSADGVLLATGDFPSQRAATALGTTFPLAKGARVTLQDGIVLGQHATVVCDGLGGHGRNDAEPVWVTQVAVGRYVAGLIDEIGRTQARPAEYLRANANRLMALVDAAVNPARHALLHEKFAACTADEDPGVRAAFVAVADFPDGVVVFGAGDASVRLLLEGRCGSTRVVAFTPQPRVASETDVNGLGGGEASARGPQPQLFARDDVRLIIAGSDGVFTRQSRLVDVVGSRPWFGDAGGLIEGSALVGKPVGEVRDTLVKTLLGRAEAARAQASKALEDSSRAADSAARRDAGRRLAASGVDDLALVVRRPLASKAPSRTEGLG